MELLSAFVILGAAGLAGFAQGFAGFGSTLVALPILGLILPARTAVPAGCLMALCMNAFLVAGLHGHIRRGWLALLVGTSLPGAALGVMLLGAAPDLVMKGLLGAATLYAAARLLRKGEPEAAPGGGWAVAAGVLAGFMGVSIGVNGPPIVAWMARQPWDARTIKATLTSYFLLAGLVIVGTQAAGGMFTAGTLHVFALSLPALIAGIWAGSASSGRLGELVFRRAFLGLLGGMGTVLLVRAAVGLLAA